MVFICGESCTKGYDSSHLLRHTTVSFDISCQGHSVTLFNRGKTALKKVPHETEDEYEKRSRETRFIKGNRQSPDDLKKLASESFDVIYDMNGREQGDTAPLADIFRGKVEHFVYMSSAGVYKKSTIMPHIEVSV